VRYPGSSGLQQRRWNKDPSRVDHKLRMRRMRSHRNRPPPDTPQMPSCSARDEGGETVEIGEGEDEQREERDWKWSPEQDPAGEQRIE